MCDWADESGPHSFIPQRSSMDMAATFQLLEPGYGANGAHGGKDGASEGSQARRLGGMGEIDALKGGCWAGLTGCTTIDAPPPRR